MIPTPHSRHCYVYKHARALIGVDRRGLCDCGAEQLNELHLRKEINRARYERSYKRGSK